MTSLAELDLKQNRLVSLPPTLSTLSKTLLVLDVSQNPFLKSPPPTVVSGGRQAILDYLSNILNSPKQVLRMKLMIVGKANIGKTSLVECLGRRWGGHDPKSNSNIPPSSNIGLSTDGIDITSHYFYGHFSHPSFKTGKKKKKGTRVNLNIWDFAGQNVYYAAHQIFLTPKAIYIVTFNLLDNDSDSQIGYWLRSIMARVSKPKIILVGTHLDEYQKLHSVDIAQLNQYFTSKYLPIVPLKFFAVSCVGTEENINILRSEIEDQISTDLSVVKELPYSHVLLEASLKEKALELSDFPILTLNDLMRLGNTCGIASMGKILECTRILHSIGSIIHFDKLGQLRDFVVLDPQWLVRMLATIFTTKHTWIKSGLMEQRVLFQHIWKQYSPSVLFKLLVLLEKFDLVYCLKDKKLNFITESLMEFEAYKFPLFLSSSESSDYSPKEVESSNHLILIPPLLPQGRPSILLKDLVRR